MAAVPASRYLTFASIALAGCAIDLATKSWIFGKLGMPGQNRVWWIWKDIFGFQTSLNPGALFGFGNGMVAVFATLSFLAIGFILHWLFVVGAARDRLYNVALACVMAGILGNLYDRLGLWSPPGARIHQVRDWILVMHKKIGIWPNFNIADSLLVCGAALLLWQALRQEKPKKIPIGHPVETEVGT